MNIIRGDLPILKVTLLNVSHLKFVLLFLSVLYHDCIGSGYVCVQWWVVAVGQGQTRPGPEGQPGDCYSGVRYSICLLSNLGPATSEGK